MHLRTTVQTATLLRHRLLGLLKLFLGLSLSPLCAQAQAQNVPPAATKYRFVESYTTAAPGAEKNPGAVGQSRIAFKETITSAVDKPQAAPVSNELVIQAIYQERPVELSAVDPRWVSAAVRRYQAVRLQPPLPPTRSAPPLFDDLTVWYRMRPGQVPSSELICMTPNRSLRDSEFSFITRQIFVPELVYALPEQPLQIGESYDVSVGAASALLGGSVQSATLSGKLLEIREVTNSPELRLAVFDLTAQGLTDRGQAATHAQMDFQFRPAPPAANSPTPNATDAVGHIVKLRLASNIAGMAAAGEAQLQQFLRRELVLERRVDDPGPLLEVPSSLPQPTLENSWLLYDDPAGQFQFRHPQALQRLGAGTPDRPGVTLVHVMPDGFEQVAFSVRQQSDLEPEAIRKSLRDDWKEAELRVEEGPAGPLPENQWGGVNVYRIEATLTPLGADAQNQPATPMRYEGYVVRPGLAVGLFTESMSNLSTPGKLRDQVETMIRNFQFFASPSITTPTEAPAATNTSQPAAPVPTAPGAPLPSSTPESVLPPLSPRQ